jgi:histidyl-tRNA synthetase
MGLQPVKGTRDLLGEEIKAFRTIVKTAQALLPLYGFEEIETPIFESSEVFAKTLGEASDIVMKEMYTFTDKGEDSLTLRPEGTAGVARALISNSMFRELPIKLFYSGPMFRRERPQKGRYRQFYQMGAELVGAATPIADFEVIRLGWSILEKLGLLDSITLEINSIGDDDSRAKYKEALIVYFKNVQSQLSEDSQSRIERNPLRILDSKSEQDAPFIEKAPKLSEYLNEESRAFFENVKTLLKNSGITARVNDRLVRGLDYYCHTVFEFTTNALGAQNAVLSGGRYDGLISMMGGPATPGVGWGAGIDRLALLYMDKHKNVDTQGVPTIGVVPLDNTMENEAARWMDNLRSAGIPAQMPYSGNLSKRLKKLERFNCVGAIIVGGSEEAQDQVQFKNFVNGEQKAILKTDIVKTLQVHIEQCRKK